MCLKKRREEKLVMMIGGGVVTPPGTARPTAVINEMVIDVIGSASVSGSGSGSGSVSPATGVVRTSSNNNESGNNNNSSLNNNNNDAHAAVVGNVASATVAGRKICYQDEDAPPGSTVTRPWEPPSPSLSQQQARSHLLQMHPARHHSHPQQQHHHQQINVQPAQLMDGL